jgi:hypothetical protein
VAPATGGLLDPSGTLVDPVKASAEKVSRCRITELCRTLPAVPGAGLDQTAHKQKPYRGGNEQTGREGTLRIGPTMTNVH